MSDDTTPDPTAEDAGTIGLEVDNNVEATPEDLEAVADELKEHSDEEVPADSPPIDGAKPSDSPADSPPVEIHPAEGEADGS